MLRRHRAKHTNKKASSNTQWPTRPVLSKRGVLSPARHNRFRETIPESCTEQPKCQALSCQFVSGRRRPSTFPKIPLAPSKLLNLVLYYSPKVIRTNNGCQLIQLKNQWRKIKPSLYGRFHPPSVHLHEGGIPLLCRGRT